VIKPETFTIETKLNAPAATVYAWHEDPSALDKLSPQSVGVEVVKPALIKVGEIAHIKVPLIPNLLKIDWLAKIIYVHKGLEFRDEQIKGPFSYWLHKHRFIPTGTGCLMRDEVEYVLPCGQLIHHLGKRFVQSQLKDMFSFRHEQLLQEFGGFPKEKGIKEAPIKTPEVHPNNPILRHADGI
jgi:ligand-binding SRPBCC domain-containing protein